MTERLLGEIAALVMEYQWDSGRHMDEAQEIAGRILALTQPSGWQPIETAPKDGTPVLAYQSFDALAGVTKVLSFDEDRWLLWPGRHVYHPTHWMPLPAPPEGE